MQKGDILGHEFMGIVQDVGSDVHKVKKGMQILVKIRI